MPLLTYGDFVTKMAETVKIINKSAIDDEILALVCEEIADRLTLYLNWPETEAGEAQFDKRLVKIAARLASGIVTQTQQSIAGDQADMQIKSISDNGQSVTFGDTIRGYLATTTDNELFGGAAELLKPYRRVHVVP